MKYKVKVEISLKSGLFDPEGETTKKSLHGLRFPVDNVKTSKVFTFFLEADSKDNVILLSEDMCKKLLANPNKDDYTITVEEQNE